MIGRFVRWWIKRHPLALYTPARGDETLGAVTYKDIEELEEGQWTD